jgi:hypothetical protein
MLSETHASIHNFETQRFVRLLRRLVIDERIRCYLGTALRTRPILGGADQLSANPSISKFLSNEPAFNVTGWP